MFGPLASPPKFHAVASWLWVWLLLAGIVLLGFGLYTGLFGMTA